LEIGHRLSVTPEIFVRSNQDLPVYWIVPSMRAPDTHAARYAANSPFFYADAVAAFEYPETLGT
jgi:hypothetical protein